MTDESRMSTEQGNVERTQAGDAGRGARNAGERTVQEQSAGGFTNTEPEGPYGGTETDDRPGEDRPEGQ